MVCSTISGISVSQPVHSRLRALHTRGNGKAILGRHFVWSVCALKIAIEEEDSGTQTNTKNTYQTRDRTSNTVMLALGS